MSVQILGRNELRNTVCHGCVLQPRNRGQAVSYQAIRSDDRPPRSKGRSLQTAGGARNKHGPDEYPALYRRFFQTL
jgi:hypothetical protein